MTLNVITGRSVRELLCTIVLVAAVSVLVTYHLYQYLPPKREQTELRIHFNGRVDIYRNYLASGDNKRDVHQGLEGIDLEEKLFPPHPPSKLTKHPPRAKTSLIAEALKRKLLEVGLPGDLLHVPMPIE